MCRSARETGRRRSEREGRFGVREREGDVAESARERVRRSGREREGVVAERERGSHGGERDREMWRRERDGDMAERDRGRSGRERDVAERERETWQRVRGRRGRE